MQKEGFWMDARAKRYYLIDEHAQWMLRPCNQEEAGLPRTVRDYLVGLDWKRDRVRILLAAMCAGFVRVRDHGGYIAIEGTMTLSELLATAQWFLAQTGLAGPFSTLRIADLRVGKRLALSGADLAARAELSLAELEDRASPIRDYACSREEMDKVWRELQAAHICGA